MYFIICVIALLLTIFRWTITFKFITKYIILFTIILWKLLSILSIVMWKSAFSHHRYEQWCIIEKGHETLKVLLEYTDGLIFMLHKYNDVIMNFLLLLLLLLLLYLKKSYLEIYFDLCNYLFNHISEDSSKIQRPSILGNTKKNHDKFIFIPEQKTISYNENLPCRMKLNWLLSLKQFIVPIKNICRIFWLI